jgi:hypothetical protein
MALSSDLLTLENDVTMFHQNIGIDHSVAHIISQKNRALNHLNTTGSLYELISHSSTSSKGNNISHLLL